MECGCLDADLCMQCVCARKQPTEQTYNRMGKQATDRASNQPSKQVTNQIAEQTTAIFTNEVC